MTRVPTWRRYLRFWGNDPVADVDDELRFHLESHAEQLVAQGMAPEAARAEALRRFGDPRAARTATLAVDTRWLRAERGAAWREALAQDARYALRSLRRTPGFAAVAVVTLALGIGANTAIVSVVNAALLRPLPFADDGRLAVVHTSFKSFQLDRANLSEPEFMDLRERARSFVAVAGERQSGVTLTGEGEAERLRARRSSANFFEVLGVRAALGRTFAVGEDRPGQDAVAILGDGLWRRRFGADPGVVGRTVQLSRTPVTVIGVLPRDFRYSDAEIYLPLVINPDSLDGRSSHYFDAVARLRPGVTIDQARAELESIAAALRQEYPENYPPELGFGMSAYPLRDRWVGAARPALLLLLGAVGVVLLITCANVANLLLARGEARQRELAVRTALGAGRGRLVRQLLTESLMLALGGAALGVAIAPAAVNALLRVYPDALPLVERVGVDWSLLGVAAAVATATGLLFGVVPALQLSRGEVHAVLKEGGRGGGAGGERGRRTRRTLVAVQLALAVIVAAAAGLLTRSFDRLTSVDPGFEPRGVLTAQVPLPRGSYQSDTAAMEFFVQLVRRLGATPGVQAAGIVGNLPLGGGSGNWDVEVEGRAPVPGEAPVSPNVQFVGGDYFRAIGMRARRGRPLGSEDDERAPLTAVINETMARMLWPGQSPLGARFRIAGPPGERWMTVVGVMNDVRQASLRDTTRGEYYVPHAQMHRSTGYTPREMYVVARTAGEPAALAPALRRILGELDPAVAPTAVRTMREVVERSVAQQRFTMLLVAGFGLLALAIAAVGVYGVTAYTVARRRTEMAVRLALGARPVDVVRLVVRQGMGVAAAGIAAGIVGALAASRVMRSMVFGVSPTDPTTYAAIAAVLLGVALVATWLPARRTTAVDPASTLRAE